METIIEKESINVKNNKDYDPLGFINFELTERLNSILVNLMGCCGRICFKESKKENPDNAVIEKYDAIACEVADVRSSSQSFDLYDTMRSLIKKYASVYKACIKFEKENYLPYVSTKIGVIAE
jgi:hypothetical protein